VQTFIDGVRGAGLQLALRLGRFNNLTDALVYSMEFEVAKNLSNKKDSVQVAKFPEDQCQTEDVVPELIVKKLDELHHRLNQNIRTNHYVLSL